MTNDTKAPARLWASYIRTQDGRWIGKHAAQDAPYRGATGYIRHDLHLSLLGAAYEDAASTARQHNLGRDYEMSQRQLDAILSRTPADAQAALNARDKRIRKEALREAAKAIGHDAGSRNDIYQKSRRDARDAILALIEKEQTDE